MLATLLGLRAKLHSIWLRCTYPFAEFGQGVSVDSSCDIRRSVAPQIRLGDNVYLAPGVWIDVAPAPPIPSRRLSLEKDVQSEGFPRYLRGIRSSWKRMYCWRPRS